MHSIQWRDATRDDLHLTYEITKDAMRGYVEQTWGSWKEREQWQKHMDHFTPETHRIIFADGEAAGFVAAEDLTTHVWLVKLYLLAAFRGRGIGSAVLARILKNADELGKPVRLGVLGVNTRARVLYARHGFEVVEQTPERIFMERPVYAANNLSLDDAGGLGPDDE